MPNIRPIFSPEKKFKLFSDFYLPITLIKTTNKEEKELLKRVISILFGEKIGEENIKKLGFYFIPAKDIILKPSLFNKDNNK